MTVAAIDRSISLIEVLAGAPAAMELSDLAEQVGLPQSAVHRTLATLVERGWVVQEPASQNYALSLRMAQLAFRNLDAQHAPDVVQDVLNRLAAQTEEYCRLAVIEQGRLIWIARAQGARVGLRYEPDMNSEVVLHATANGKAWLSTMAENDAIAMAYAGGMATRPGRGPNGVRSVDDLRAHLARARMQGFATAEEEAEPGIAAIAVPFFRNDMPDAAVAGTMSVAGPTLRIRPARYPALCAELQKAAADISALWPVRQRMRSGAGGTCGGSGPALGCSGAA